MASTGRAPLGTGPFWRGTVAVHWFLALGALILLTSPTAVVGVPLLVPDASNLPLVALLLLPTAPAVSAAVFAWERYGQDRDSGPARAFLRGYRLNWRDALAVWAPALAVLTVLGLNVANLGAVGGGLAVAVVSGLLGLAVACVAAHATVLGSLFSFRKRDLLRLAVHHLGASWPVTLRVVSLVVVTVGSVVLVSDWVLLFLAAPLTYLLHAGARPMVEAVRRDFTTAPKSRTAQ